MYGLQPEARAQLKTRLARIEGQVRGVQRMLDEGRDCQEILQQLAAIRSAVRNASVLVARTYAEQCLHEPGGETDVKTMLDLLVRTLAEVK